VACGLRTGRLEPLRPAHVAPGASGPGVGRALGLGGRLGCGGHGSGRHHRPLPTTHAGGSPRAGTGVGGLVAVVGAGRGVDPSPGCDGGHLAAVGDDVGQRAHHLEGLRPIHPTVVDQQATAAAASGWDRRRRRCGGRRGGHRRGRPASDVAVGHSRCLTHNSGGARPRGAAAGLAAGRSVVAGDEYRTAERARQAAQRAHQAGDCGCETAQRLRRSLAATRDQLQNRSNKRRI
jgi:hypothetical protein